MNFLSFLDEQNPPAGHKTVTPPKVRSPQWNFNDFSFESPNPDATENNVFRRAYLVGLSLLFPEGERFFIRAVKRYADQISDPQLKKDVKSFIAQEAQHGRQHELLNEKIFGSRYDVDSFLKNWTGFAFGFLEKFSEKYLPYGGGKLEVAVTAAAEHFTATWGAAALKSESFAKFDSQSIKDLIYWHAIEEIEHKHVAFDVLRAVDDNYLLRIGGIAFLAVMMPAWVGLGFIYLLAQEKDVDLVALVRDAYADVSSENGLTRQFVKAFFSYFRPGFHPDDIDDERLVTEIAATVEQSIKASAA